MRRTPATHSSQPRSKTGYSSGEITFSLSSVIPNLQHLPAPLVKSMPMVVLALGALGWMTVPGVVSRWRRGIGGARRTTDRRDVVIGSFLALGWVGIWGLYSAYDWTARMAGGTGGIQVIRFYLPALGLITLLAAWLLFRLPRWLTIITLVAVIGLGAWSYADLAAGGMGPGGGIPGGRPGIGVSAPPGAPGGAPGGIPEGAPGGPPALTGP